MVIRPGVLLQTCVHDASSIENAQREDFLFLGKWFWGSELVVEIWLDLDSE